MKLLKMFSFIIIQASLFFPPWWAFSQSGTRALKCGSETVTWSSPGTTISNPTSSTPQACIEQRQFGAGNATFYAITVAVTGAPGTVTYAWPTPEGPIQFVNSTGTTVLTGTQTGPTVWIRATTPAALANQNWGKARLKCEYVINNPPCSCKGFGTLDLFKQINSTIFPIIGPTCITTDGTPYTFSVDPVFSRNVSDGIGVDHYNWLTSPAGGFVQQYQAGDNSSKTYTFTGSGPFTLNLTSGSTCNNSPAPTRTLQLGSPPISISNPTFGSPSTAYSIPAGQTGPRSNWELCLDADKSATLTLSVANPQAGTIYTWEALSGFTPTGQITGTSATFTPTATANRAQGLIRVSTPATAGGCPGSTANVIVYRRLSSTYSIIRPTVAANCLNPGTLYTFTLQGPAGNINPPAGATYAWTLPSSNPSNQWSFVGATTGTSVVCRVAPGGNPTLIQEPSCSIVNTGGLAASCNFVVNPTGSNYSVAGPKTYSVVTAQVPGTNFYTTTFNGGILNGGFPTDNVNNPGTRLPNYLYEWFYSSAINAPDKNDDAAWTALVNPNLPCNQNQYINVNGSGWLYCRVTGRLTGPVCTPAICTTATCSTIVTCLSLRSNPVQSSQNRPRDGGSGTKFSKLNEEANQKIMVVPNPGKIKIEIRLEGFSKNGSLMIIGMDGKTVLEENKFTPGGDIDIAKLQQGLYMVLFQNEEGTITSTFQKE